MTGQLCLAEVNSRAPTWLVAVTGLVAFAVVAGMWVLTRAAVTIAHEGSHALTASAMGGKVDDINIYREGGGLTNFKLEDNNSKLLLVTLAGYLGPPLFGVCGAVLLSTGRVHATLWLSFFFLVCALFLAKGWYSIVTIVATGAVIFIMIRYAGDDTQTFFTYTWIWYLLIGGIAPCSNWPDCGQPGPTTAQMPTSCAS